MRNEFTLSNEDREILRKSAQIFNRLMGAIDECGLNVEDDVHIIGRTETFYSTDAYVTREILDILADSPKILLKQNENFA